jgi:hypothetical protein
VLFAYRKLYTCAQEDSSRTMQFKNLLVRRNPEDGKQRRKYKSYSLPEKGRKKQID